VSGKAGGLGDLLEVDPGFLPGANRSNQLPPGTQHSIGSAIHHLPSPSDPGQIAASGRCVGCAEISGVQHTVT